RYFFQAEDGIRAFHVTGVQTCALPIWAIRPTANVQIYTAERLPTVTGDDPVEKLFRPLPERGSRWPCRRQTILDRFWKLSHRRWATPCPKAVGKRSQTTQSVAWRAAFSFCSTLQNGHHALPTRRADGDQPALALTRHAEQLGQVGNNTTARSGKG